MSDISFNTASKELKIAQIAQLNQLFRLLHLAHICGHCFYWVSRMLMSKNVNNDVSKDSPIEDKARKELQAGDVLKAKESFCKKIEFSSPWRRLWH